MQQVYKRVAEEVAKRGITNAELARRTGITNELLRRSLIGERNMKADEFVLLCGELNLQISDFEN